MPYCSVPPLWPRFLLVVVVMKKWSDFMFCFRVVLAKIHHFLTIGLCVWYNIFSLFRLLIVFALSFFTYGKLIILSSKRYFHFKAWNTFKPSQILYNVTCLQLFDLNIESHAGMNTKASEECQVSLVILK